MPSWSFRRKPTSRRRAAQSAPFRPQVEKLESRRLLATLPYGALPEETAEFMLGRAAVTVVFLESNGAVDTNHEDNERFRLFRYLERHGDR